MLIQPVSLNLNINSLNSAARTQHTFIPNEVNRLIINET